jgi:biphenyl 2,3-dioxygenase beta subunit
MSNRRIALKHELIREVEQFLYREARLLDDARFQEWLDLLTDDIRYWMPVMGRRYRSLSKGITPLAANQGEEEQEFASEGELAILDETKETLCKRVARLETGMAWAEDPPSSTCHIISNVGVAESGCGSEVIVHSNFILYRTRGEMEQDFYVGSRQDVLRSIAGDWRIAYRKIILPQHVLAAKNASNFF